MLNQLLESSSAVLSDNFDVQYTEEFGIKDTSLNPTVYEFLRRFEWNKMKSNIEFLKDGLNHSINQTLLALIFIKAQAFLRKEVRLIKLEL